MRRLFVPAVLLAALAVFSAVSAAQEKKGNEEKPKRTILTVSDAVADALKYRAVRVVVVGMFMGGDGACKRPSPRQNDWMLQDKQGTCIWSRGMYPEGCVARTREGVGRDVSVEGYIILDKGVPVLISTRMEKVAEENKKKQAEILKQKQEQTIEKMRAADKAAVDQKIYTVSEIVANPAIFMDSAKFVKGQYYPKNGKCKEPAPAVKQIWMLQDLYGACVYVDGPKPERDGKALASGGLVTINVEVKKITVKGKTVYYLRCLPDPAPAEEPEKK